MYVSKQPFHRLYGQITQEFLGFRMQNFQGFIFIWTQTYKEIFKSALVYLQWWDIVDMHEQTEYVVGC